jgi:bacteriocin leader peptide (microcyclamide/patellamide family)
MDKKNLMPIAAQPVNRTTTGQLPPELAELSEEALQVHENICGKSASSESASVLPQSSDYYWGSCSYGDDAE